MNSAPAKVQAGRIININTNTHTYDVITDSGYQLKDLPIMFPYSSNEKGQGINYIPEIGTRCIVCNTVTGEDFILGFIIPVGIAKEYEVSTGEETTKNSYVGRSGNKSEDLLPGDIEIKTSSGNKLRVLAGGVIEIVSKEGLCLSKYIANPGENLIITKSDIIESILGCGNLLWKTDNDKRTGSLLFNLKTNIDNTDPDISIRMGASSESNGLEVLIGNSDDPSAKLSFNEDGSVILSCKSLHVKTDEDLLVESKNATLKASSQIKLSGSNISLN